MKRIVLALACVAALGGHGVGAEDRGTRAKGSEPGYELVAEVKEVSIRGTRVIATGSVSSRGWTEPRLVPFRESPDGVYRLRLEAKPPSGPSAQVITPTGPVEFDFEMLPADLHKVVVEARDNSREAVSPGEAEGKDPSERSVRAR